MHFFKLHVYTFDQLYVLDKNTFSYGAWKVNDYPFNIPAHSCVAWSLTFLLPLTKMCVGCLGAQPMGPRYIHPGH